MLKSISTIMWFLEVCFIQKKKVPLFYLGGLIIL